MGMVSRCVCLGAGRPYHTLTPTSTLPRMPPYLCKTPQGVKAADAVLKKFPKHGETQAMKALVLNCLDKKEEVRAFAGF